MRTDWPVKTLPGFYYGDAYSCNTIQRPHFCHLFLKADLTSKLSGAPMLLRRVHSIA
jgi:hypothetical protein